MTSVFSFAEDLLGEGISTVLDRIKATGADSITVAASYHQARDLFPHNPRGATQYLPSGSTAFQPTVDDYGLLKPSPSSERRGLLTELVTAATARGMGVHSWTVLLHNSRLGHTQPEATLENALGDRLRHALCPAHPEVRTYAAALARDLAAHGVTSLNLEALTAGGYDHGETHERVLIYLGETARFLLGLCFCTHCRAAGHAAEIDVTTLAQRVRHILNDVLRSHQYATSLPPLSHESLHDLLGESVLAYLSTRARTVSTLAAEVVTAVKSVSESTRVTLIDPSGAALGYASGRPDTEQTAVSLAWQEGLDHESLSAHLDIAALCYFADPDRLQREVTNYVSTQRDGSQLAAVLRPTWPDVTSAEDLVANVRAARLGGAADVHFYTYGLVRLESLEWIHRALTAN